MKGNKGQRGERFIGLRVKSKKYGTCTVVHQMSDEEYEQSGKDFTRYFTIEDCEGNQIQCGRDGFIIPRKES